MLEMGVLAALLAVGAAGAAWRGGAAERQGALLLAGGGAVLLLGGDFRLALAADVILTLALGRIAWRAHRTWPVWALGCHAVAAAATLAFAMQPDVAAETWRRALYLAHGGGALALALNLWLPRKARP